MPNPFVILPLYAVRDKNKSPAPKSGINQGWADGRIRHIDETYIPVPKLIHDNHSGILPDNTTQTFQLNLPNKKTQISSLCQQGAKGLMTKPNKILGQYILRNLLKVPTSRIATRADLVNVNCDSVRIELNDDSSYSLYPEYLGAYEDFKNGVYSASVTELEETPDEDIFNDDEDIKDFSATEGKQKLVTHKRLERQRNSKLPKAKKDKVFRETGKLACEGCDFNFAEVYGKHGEKFIECHHKTPIHELTDETVTKLDDLALLCANCHRMVHRKKKWLTIPQLQKLIANNKI